MMLLNALCRCRTLVAAITSCSILSACSTTSPVVNTSPHPELNDALFPTYTLFDVESEQRIFALNDAAKAFVDDAVNEYVDENPQIRSLIKRIFAHSELGLLYRGDANSVAAETFNAGAANCLSLSIMTYAMAQYGGFDAAFYEVEIPEYWTRRAGYSLLNGHINLRVKKRAEPTIHRLLDDYIDVDFDPQDSRNQFNRFPISKDRVLAMFYNNKGADALMANSYSKAYAYFRQAAITDPTFTEVWVNLGILYRRNDAYLDAERSYKRAIQIDEDDLTAWDNLAILYDFQGNHEQAQLLREKVNQRRLRNPYYHYIQGEEAFEQEQFAQALSHFKHAMKLDENRHEILFAMGKTYYELGDVELAKRYLGRAASRAGNDQDEQRYRGKLSLLQNVAQQSTADEGDRLIANKKR